ncbi:Outer dense fiber protein 3B, partial [Coelomomyces lativittatus]
DNPGPAKYHIVDPQLYGPKVPAYTITSRSIKENPLTTPGPATYSIPSTIGTKQIAVIASPAPTIAPSRHSKLISNSPGPAAYQPVNPTKLHHSSPAYSLGARWEKDSSIAYANTIPGPGKYNPADTNKHSTPSYSFRQKHSEYEHFVNDPDNGPLVL